MKLSFNKYYLIFSLVGWLLLFTTTLAGPKVFLPTKELLPEQVLYYWLETLACSILAFTLSFILSVFIDEKIKFNDNWRNIVLKIIVVFMISQMLYSLLVWPILHLIGNYTGYESVRKVTMEGKIFNVFYFATLFFIWLFVFLTIKIYHQLKRVQLKQLQLEANLKESQLNTLKGQINPHFMFNSLNNIRGLMLEDINKARNMLTNLSETLRYSLTKSNVDSVLLEDELDMVENYVEISKIQFDERLKFEKKIDEASLTKQIPPMMIQMLIENAIKHGISNLKEGGKIVLSTIIKDGELTIKVLNSGTIKQTKNTTQLGIENIKKRLLLLYGEQATFTLNEMHDEVLATIKIPIK